MILGDLFLINSLSKPADPYFTDNVLKTYMETKRRITGIPNFI